MGLMQVHKSLYRKTFSKEGRERRREKVLATMDKKWKEILLFLANPNEGRVTKPEQKCPQFGSGIKTIPEGYDAGETGKQRKERMRTK